MIRKTQRKAWPACYFIQNNQVDKVRSRHVITRVNRKCLLAKIPTFYSSITANMRGRLDSCETVRTFGQFEQNQDTESTARLHWLSSQVHEWGLMGGGSAGGVVTSWWLLAVLLPSEVATDAQSCEQHEHSQHFERWRTLRCNRLQVLRLSQILLKCQEHIYDIRRSQKGKM